MSGKASDFLSITPYRGIDKISIVDGTNLPIAGIGVVRLNDTTLNDVLLVPKLSENLISVGQLVENNCHVIFSSDGCVI
jgi:hypothetical protein